ncbi:hypothetical protein OQJ02_06345 [Legionella sp. PATHC032]|nr:hypothetical protein [Legionella sp. PATHC032]MCW8421252.1 hypothetical protein [Legionella sp. PATHC032]HAZ7573087.1 hypothetical protein [Legionella pneumophila]HBA1635740.1 hypothetical protein [Legionella pneumophila]
MLTSIVEIFCDIDDFCKSWFAGLKKCVHIYFHPRIAKDNEDLRKSHSS